MSGKLSEYQLESLDLLALVKNPQDMIAIRNLISDYFAKKTVERGIEKGITEGKTE